MGNHRPGFGVIQKRLLERAIFVSAEDVSQFLLHAVKAEGKVLDVFRTQFRQHETTLRALRDIRVERIIKNHAQVLALIEALAVVVPIAKEQIRATSETLIQMTLDRQPAINVEATMSSRTSSDSRAFLPSALSAFLPLCSNSQPLQTRATCLGIGAVPLL